MTKPKLIALTLALALAGAASAEPNDVTVMTRNNANATSKTNTSTATVGLPSAVAARLTPLAPMPRAKYEKDVFERDNGLRTFAELERVLIEEAGGLAGYQMARAGALESSGLAVGKTMAKQLKACKTEQCVLDFAYKDKMLTLMMPAAFSSKRIGLAETKLMNRRYINDARAAPYMQASIFHSESANRLLAAAIADGKIPKSLDAAADTIISRLVQMPVAQFSATARVAWQGSSQDRVNHGEPGTPIEFYLADTGRVYKLTDEGVTITANGAPYFDGRHINGREVTVSASGSQSTTGTTTTSY